ncbi:MAG TPA: hypothetical protein VFR97_12465 [Capillimicrobium sp.]|nr:hypothetical protein [Capillimicrobium sp.]
MPRLRDFVVQDRRQDRRRPAWEWSTELTESERAELAALRAERDELLARVDELHVAAQEAHDREEALSALVRELSTGAWWSRLAAARRLRRHAEAAEA